MQELFVCNHTAFANMGNPLPYFLFATHVNNADDPSFSNNSSRTNFAGLEVWLLFCSLLCLSHTRFITIKWNHGSCKSWGFSQNISLNTCLTNLRFCCICILRPWPANSGVRSRTSKSYMVHYRGLHLYLSTSQAIFCLVCVCLLFCFLLYVMFVG